MTDQIDPNFLAFSEMLDQEEGLDPSRISGLSSDGALLVGLRQELRSERPIPSLPEDFARSTAQSVELRFQAQSGLTRRLLKWEPSLRANLLSPTAASWLFASALLGLGALATSWKALGLLGLLALLPGLGLKRLLDRHLPRHLALPGVPADLVPDASAKASPFFFLLPLLAITATSGLIGRLVTALGSVSLSFSTTPTNMKLAGMAGALVVFVWLVNALWPLLRAYEEATRGRKVRTLLVQSLYGGWLTVVLGILLQETSSESLLLRADFGESLVLGGFVGVLLCCAPLLRRRRPETRQHSLAKAYRRTAAGLLVGAVPIIAVLATFYQVSLTRTMTVKPQYDVMVEQTEAWLKAQKAIPADQNGATELRAILFSRGETDGEAYKIAGRLKGGAKLYVLNTLEEERGTETFKKEAAVARKEFLRELPRIERAVSKPEFSYMQDQPLDLQRQVPNYITCRAISQALAALTVDSLDSGDSATALAATELNLRWASKFREGVLIDLMISIAMEKISMESFERLLFEGKLSRAQLVGLDATLEQTAPKQSDFVEVMRRENYSVDQEFQNLARGERKDIGLYSMPKTLVRYIPRSYWESERLVFLNLQLGRAGDWMELGHLPDEIGQDIASMLPWSLVAQEMVPNLQRAKGQVLASLGNFTVARLQVALELYKIDHDGYPPTLQALVPNYLPVLPIDPAHPNLWKHKGGYTYQRQGSGYQMISESPAYESISLNRTQVYGPGRIYEMER